MRWFLVGSWMVIRKAKPWLEVLNFQPHFPEKGEGVEVEIMIDKTYWWSLRKNSPNCGAQRAASLGTACGGAWRAIVWGGVGAPLSFLHTLPCISPQSSRYLCSSSYPLIMNWWRVSRLFSLGSLSHSNKWIEPEVGLGKPLVYSGGVRSTGNCLDLRLALEAWGVAVLWDWILNQWDLMLSWGR